MTSQSSERRASGTETTFEERMAEKFAKLVYLMWEVHLLVSKMKEKRSLLGHIVVKTTEC